MKTRSTHNHQYPVRIKFPKKGMTKQMHKEECDINHIMLKFQKSGVIDHVNKHQQDYGFCTSTDLHESLNLINTANDMFDELPSQARKKFHNNPGEFLDYVQDPENKEKLFDLGLTDYPITPLTLPEKAENTPSANAEEKPVT